MQTLNSQIEWKDNYSSEHYKQDFEWLLVVGFSKYIRRTGHWPNAAVCIIEMQRNWRIELEYNEAFVSLLKRTHGCEVNKRIVGVSEIFSPESTMIIGTHNKHLNHLHNHANANLASFFNIGQTH